MPIYDVSTVELVKRFLVEEKAPERFTNEDVLRWFGRHYPKIKESTIKAHLLKLSTNVATRVYYQAKPGVHDLLFRTRPGEFRRYDADRDPPPIYGDSVSLPIPRASFEERSVEVVDAQNSAITQSEGDNEFAYEAHLREFLVKNLGVLEPGLRLYQDGEGIQGVEFPIRQRFIDILAESRDGSLVVIELKVSRGHDRTVGQILTYLGWVKRDIAEGKPVRGMIVAKELSEDLKTAVQESAAAVQLFEYELSFRVRPVDPTIRVITS